MDVSPERSGEFGYHAIIVLIGRLWFWLGFTIACAMVFFAIAMFSGKLQEPDCEEQFTVFGGVALGISLLLMLISFLCAVRAKGHPAHHRPKRIENVWLRPTRSWSKQMEAGGIPPHLRLGGTMVTAFVTSTFSASAACALVVILIYGWRAFFLDGLRVADWKHGILSTGQSLSGLGKLVMGVLSFVLWIWFIGSVEWMAGYVPSAFNWLGRWRLPITRLIGGGLLYMLACLFYNLFEYVPAFHPVPFSAFIGGIVLMIKGGIGLFRALWRKTDA